MRRALDAKAETRVGDGRRRGGGTAAGPVCGATSDPAAGAAAPGKDAACGAVVPCTLLGGLVGRVPGGRLPGPLPPATSLTTGDTGADRELLKVNDAEEAGRTSGPLPGEVTLPGLVTTGVGVVVADACEKFSSHAMLVCNERNMCSNPAAECAAKGTAPELGSAASATAVGW